MMRSGRSRLLVVVLVAGCGGRQNIECEESGNCNLSPGGVCTANAATGNQWCAYPDPACPGGYRFSDVDVGDGVGGECVAELQDGGIDAPPDAIVGDGNITCMPRIAFADGATGQREVWVTNTDGSGKQNVSNSASKDDWRPSWSPDGKKLVFESNRTGNFDVFVVNADGSGLINLTPTSAQNDVQAVWSPDGAKIAFVSNSTPWVMNADGSNPTQVSTLTQVNDLAWSPDSTKILFGHISPQTGFPAIYVASLGGGTPVGISGGLYSVGASWAPNNKIVFYGGSSNTDVFTVNADGSALVNVTQTTANESVPKQNGNTIVLTSDANGRREVWRVAATGGSQTQVTTNVLDTSGTGDFVTDATSTLVAFNRVTSTTASQIGVIGIDGSSLATFDAGGGNARGAVFATCP